MAVQLPQHSKKQVNRAGKLLREVRAALDADHQAALEAIDRAKCYEAVAIVEGWRGLHARPLAKVNANLTYYLKNAGAEPQVTQCLKRFSTIALLRGGRRLRGRVASLHGEDGDETREGEESREGQQARSRCAGPAEGDRGAHG